MHDQKKKETEVLSAEQEAAAAAEHERVGVFYLSILHASKSREDSSKTLDDSEALLIAVPEAYTAYNCRRRALATVWATENASRETKVESLRKELKLNSKVLLMNYKNYNAFVHRHWVFDQLEALAEAELREVAGKSSHDSPAATPTFELLQQLLQKERAQCEQLLQLDERNFHAWNYRRWVLAQEARAAALALAHDSPANGDDGAAGASEKTHHVTTYSTSFSPDEASELAYTTQKIKNNFSNYSAWHQRSLAVKSAVARWNGQWVTTHSEETRKSCHQTLLTQLREDVSFLEQAVYCDPNDQSAWFYAPFVLQLLRDSRQTVDEAVAATALADTLMCAVIDLIAEVDRVGSEDDCYLPFYFILDQLITLQAAGDANSTACHARYTAHLCDKVASLGSRAAGQEEGQRSACCYHFLHERLCRADALRKGLYDDMLKRATELTS